MNIGLHGFGSSSRQDLLLHFTCSIIIFCFAHLSSGSASFSFHLLFQASQLEQLEALHLELSGTHQFHRNCFLGRLNRNFLIGETEDEQHFYSKNGCISSPTTFRPATSFVTSVVSPHSAVLAGLEMYKKQKKRAMKRVRPFLAPPFVRVSHLVTVHVSSMCSVFSHNISIFIRR